MNKQEKKQDNMIKNYKIFKESLLNKLNGPTEEEVFNNIKNNPEKLFDMGVELNKKEWIILSLKKDKEQNYKNSGFCSFNDIADFFEKYKLSDDEKIEILDLLKTATHMLKVSIKSDFVKGIIYSIKRGADVNKISPNLYIGVVRRNDIDVLKTLIENGLNDEIISILKKEAENSNSCELKNYFSNYIKTYESLLNKLEGPDEDEIINNLKKNPVKLYNFSYENDFQEGIDYALEHGVKELINRIENELDKLRIIEDKYNFNHIKWVHKSGLYMRCYENEIVIEQDFFHSIFGFNDDRIIYNDNILLMKNVIMNKYGLYIRHISLF